MKKKSGAVQIGLVVGGMMVTLALAASSGESAAGVTQPEHVAAASPEAAGRYLVIVGGCNDCHTPGWGETNGNVPEGEWLTGAPVGFRGPWGTSYPSNLRLSVQAMGEEAWVARLRAGQGLPPMPWMNVARMSDTDLRAMYRFIRTLGPGGDFAPAAVAPGVEPATPYIVFEPVMPGGGH